jgi:acyl-CoA reductase-like NAD-dependent aldehyde dehydrogenase
VTHRYPEKILWRGTLVEKLDSFNPRTGGLIGSVVVTQPEEVVDVVQRSRTAFDQWSLVGHDERRRYLKAFKKTLLGNMDRLAEMLHEEAGKDRADAYVGDVAPAIGLVDYYVRNAEKLLRPRRASTRPMVMTRGWTEYHPRGVVAVIPSYNFPRILTMVSVVPPLASGCSVILKPS